MDKNQQRVKNKGTQRLLDRWVLEETDRQRTPAILQTNSQIYKEASFILYSELQLVVRPGNTLMNFRGDDDNQTQRYVDGVEVGTMRVWRHLPYHGFGHKVSSNEAVDGLVIYTECAREVTTELQVEIEPHVFARFQRVRYEAYFNFQHDGDHWPPLYYIGNDPDEQHRSKSQFFTYIKDATACQFSAVSSIQQFVSLLSKSPIVSDLEVALTIRTPFRWVCNHYDSGLPAKQFQEVFINIGAYGLFLESGALEPLKQLTNVRCFNFDFAPIKYEYEIQYRVKRLQPKQKYLDTINDVKTTIERNWVSKQGCT